ncbi:MAG: copper resistance protein CopC, partial [Chloroflexota bacterium]|nr:copper resistance protein CopC [Chloroflexota bacterium]
MIRSGLYPSTIQHRRAVLLGLLLALVGLLWPDWASSVAAHAALERSDPATGAVLAAAPARVTLRFTEPLEYSYSRAELFDQTGAAVPATSQPGADHFELTLELPPNLANGTYSVLWRSLSTADGHTAQNYIAFTIGTSDDVMSVMPPATVAPGGPPAWLEAAARWLALLGLAAALAVWPLWLFVLRPAIGGARSAGAELARRTQRFAVWAIGVALLGSVAALLVQAATLESPGASYLDQLQTTLGDTRYGWLWLIRIVALLTYGIVLTGCG